MLGVPITRTILGSILGSSCFRKLPCLKQPSDCARRDFGRRDCCTLRLCTLLVHTFAAKSTLWIDEFSEEIQLRGFRSGAANVSKCSHAQSKVNCGSLHARLRT